LLVQAILKPLILAALLVTAGAAGAATKPKDSPKPATPARSPEIEILKSPMVFYLARGGPDACGPGCSEWIAAEGRIEIGTSERMRAFLKRQPGPKRPIYFYSPGGYASDALAMGRLMHERALTAGVGRTIAEGCEPKECTEFKKSGRELKAKLNSFAAECDSACVYAFVGARTREVAPQAILGIHAAKTEFIKKIPKGVRIPPNFFSNFHKESNRKIARYLVDMGIKPALLDAAEKIPHEDIKALTRDEIARFGIDTRSLVESAWFFDEKIFGRASVVKSVSESAPGGAAYRTTTFGLFCLTSGQIMVSYFRNVDEGQNLGPLKVSTGGKDFSLTPAKNPIVGGDVKTLRDFRHQWVPVGFFQSAVADDHMTIAEEGQSKNPPTKISTLGLSAALGTLEKQCGYLLLSPSDRASLTPSHLP
jgi:hypothetical protein